MLDDEVKKKADGPAFTLIKPVVGDLFQPRDGVEPPPRGIAIGQQIYSSQLPCVWDFWASCGLVMKALGYWS